MKEEGGGRGGGGGSTGDDVDDHGFDICFGTLAAFLEKRVYYFALARVRQGRVAGGANGLEQGLAHLSGGEPLMRHVAVHELQLDAVGVEQRGELDDLCDDGCTVGPLGALVHGAAVVDEHDQVEQGQLGEVSRARAKLWNNAAARCAHLQQVGGNLWRHGVFVAKGVHVPLPAQLLRRVQHLLRSADGFQLVRLHRLGDGFVYHFGCLIHCNGAFLRLLRRARRCEPGCESHGASLSEDGWVEV